MDDILTLHDHSRPCEHGSLWAHAVHPTQAKWWNEPECLGGREVMLRRTDERTWQEVDQDEYAR